MEGSSLSPFLAVRGNVDSTRTRAPQSPSALSASSHLLAPADASGDLAGVRRQSARRASPSAPRNPSQDTSLLPQARGCFPKFFLPPEQGRRPSTSAVCPAAPPLPSPPSLRVLAPAPLRLSRAPSAPGTAAKAAEPARTDPGRTRRREVAGARAAAPDAVWGAPGFTCAAERTELTRREHPGRGEP